MKTGGRIDRRPSRVRDDYHLVIDSDKQTWWRSLPSGVRTVVATFAAVAGVSAALYVAFLLARKGVRDKAAKIEQNKSFGQDKHATWAKLLKLGIDNDGWWGTNVPLIRRTMREIPSQEDFALVVKSYAKMYRGANLIADLTDDLTKEEYQEMMAIKNGKPLKAAGSNTVKVYDPTGWAKRLHAAVNYTWIGFMPGTDEDAIKAVFLEMPTRKAFYETANVYRKIYGASLYADLDGDLNWSWDWAAEINKKPPK